MNATLSIEEDVLREARHRAQAMGKSLNQLIREYIEHLAGKADPEEAAAEFERLSRASTGDSKGWKFNREEIHERR
ncbi:MAG TPA: DUF6364 family protein [Bryobacteraceae bacterium]|jgi:hypothetical protein|nr:DUF6364 family protein [Bryobacteraceae bacterium]